MRESREQMMSDVNSMKGKRAIVTGGGTGLGAATALGLARRGVNLCINYNSSAEAANEVVAECQKLGVEAFAVKANVAEDADCRALVDAAVTKFGGLDVLINNAGITKFAAHSDLDALDAEDFLRLYKVNVVAVYQMTRAAQPHLASAGKASVVNVSSIAGVTGIGSSIAYASTKGALNTMTLSLARALARARSLFESDGVADAAALRNAIIEAIEGDSSARLDYVEIVSQETIQPIGRIEPGNTLIALAARFGKTRLIDNIRL